MVAKALKMSKVIGALWRGGGAAASGAFKANLTRGEVVGGSG